jgi:hypothetical protein
MVKLAVSRPLLAVGRLALVLGLCSWAATAAAGPIVEPNGLSIPQPLSADLPYETSPGSLTLQSLFSSRGETIDWQLDAETTPAVFSPLCGFTGTLVLRGGGCKVDFGWYNQPADNTPPPDAEIYILVPQTDPIFDNTFQPQVGETGETFSATSIQTDPNYTGGLIGFAFRGNPSQACSQTHFSQQELNIECTNCTPNAPWITTLIYKSTATPNAYYVAFEDLPMAPTSFGGFPGQQYTNDGDFNDFVYFITGINCQGAGQPCSTGLMGACAAGLTDCTSGTAQMTCQQQTQATPEKCDGIDNDCNGLIDDGPGLCPTNEVCDKGQCVHSCAGGEFPCDPGLVCNGTGYCVEAACKTVTCPAGQVCHGGTCSGPCDGVVCPKQQTCNPGLGACVDPCAGITCGMGQTCDGGACVIACTCLPCTGTQVCQPTSGACVDPGCDTMTCPSGTVCSAGACVDACQGAMCPGGAACTNGQCGTPAPSSSATGSTGSTGGSVFAGVGSSSGGGTGGSGGASASGAGGTGGSGGAPMQRQNASQPFCACLVAGEGPPGVGAGASALALLAFGLRRRRGGARTPRR